MREMPVSYSTLKALKTATGLAWCYSDPNDANTYTVFIVDIPRDAVYFTTLPKDDGEDQTDFDGAIKPSATLYSSLQDGEASQLVAFIVAPRTGSGVPIVAAAKTDDARATFITHDWTDKTTWYTASVYVVDEVATDSGNHLLYRVAHQNVIDTYHGKISDENYLKDSNAKSYRVSVKVNDVAVVEQDPHFGTGGDFTFDYETGELTFLVERDPAHVIKVTYHYATTSSFTVKPSAGKVMTLVLTEVQLSVDVVPTDSVLFQPYGWVQCFAPGYGGLPDNTLIPLGNPSVFKGIKDFLNGSVKAYPKYPAIGGSGWRGVNQDTIVFDWDYVANTIIDGTKGMEIRVTLQHDTEWTGTFATATFYATQR